MTASDGIPVPGSLNVRGPGCLRLVAGSNSNLTKSISYGKPDSVSVVIPTPRRLSVVKYGWQSPEDTFMPIPGEGLAIAAKRLRDLLDQSPALQRHLLRYVQVMMPQMAQTALSNGQTKLEERRARWLLRCHDRASEDAIDLTHRFLVIKDLELELDN